MTLETCTETETPARETGVHYGPLRNINYKCRLNYMERVVQKYGQFQKDTTPLTKLEPFLLAKNTIELELASNDLLFWYANRNSKRYPERMKGLERSLHDETEENPSVKAATPALGLSRQLRIGHQDNLTGLNGYDIQAREILKLLDISNVALRMYGVHKEYGKGKKKPLMIRANQ